MIHFHSFLCVTEGVGGGDDFPVTGDERLGELLRREWVRPDALMGEDKVVDEVVLLPWQREGEEEREKGGVEEGEKGLRKRRVKAPTLAELTLEDEVLRRLRREGMRIRERINVPKAGLTKEVMEKIHERWRKEELVRLKFHEDLARDMKTAHEIVEVCLISLVCLNFFVSVGTMALIDPHNMITPTGRVCSVYNLQFMLCFNGKTTSTQTMV